MIRIFVVAARTLESFVVLVECLFISTLAKTIPRTFVEYSWNVLGAFVEWSWNTLGTFQEWSWNVRGMLIYQ